jgi:DNA-binding transcriptional LysR family regulator
MLIDRLERHYRVQLVARQGRGIVLTTAGEVLYEHARDMIEAEHRLERELDFAREIDHGWVRIGVERSATHFLSPIVSRFKASHSDVLVRVETSSADVVRSLLRSRRVDFACMTPQDDDELTNTPLHRERIVIIAQASDPLACCPVVSRDETRRRPFVIADRTADIRRQVELEEALGCTGREGLIVALEAAGEEAVKEAVRAGQGYGLMPQALVERELQQGLLREVTVEGVALVEEICLVRRKRSVLSAAASLLYTTILNAGGRATLASTG